MKRRNAECGKLRRPLKRNKITEGIYGSTLLYLKFLLLWAMVIFADFILEFRFEFLWPFWLLLRSVYDSFKYQGLAFSVFFICIALTSDMICFFFIPVHWLFFAASTYVWVQYVWHTDKGVCLPTVMLWLLFLYIEAAIRLRDLRHMPFHLDLCRPFAAHCIGYPVVTLGFGFKSYVGYRMRLRKQKDVAKENEFYLQLLQQALPVELQQNVPTSHQVQTQSQSQIVAATAATTSSHTENQSKLQPQRPSTQYNPSPEKSRENGGASTDTSVIQNGGIHDAHTSSAQSVFNTKNNRRLPFDKNESNNIKDEHNNKHNTHNSYNSSSDNNKNDKKSQQFAHSNGTVVGATHHHNDIHFIERVNFINTNSNSNNNSGVDNNDVEIKEKSAKGNSHNSIKSQLNGSAGGKWNNNNNSNNNNNNYNNNNSNNNNNYNNSNNSNQAKDSQRDTTSSSVNSNNQRERKSQRQGSSKNVVVPDNTTIELQKQQDEYCQRVIICRKLESDVKRLKGDLQTSRQTEQELRSQINNLLTGERQAKDDIQQLQHDNDQLTSKVQGLVSARQSDKQTITSLERRIAEERRARTVREATLVSETKRARRVAEEARSAAVSPASATPAVIRQQECTDACKTRRAQMEQDIKNLRRDVKNKEERCLSLEKDATHCKDSHGETEILLNALNVLQEKNLHLENSLSAETRIKLDLFSALGEAKRQLEIRENIIRSQEKEVEILKAKIAQDLAVMPQDTFGPQTASCTTSILRLSNSDVRVGGSKLRGTDSPCPGCTVSNLDPNATAYTPKGSLIASTEA